MVMLESESNGNVGVRIKWLCWSRRHQMVMLEAESNGNVGVRIKW